MTLPLQLIECPALRWRPAMELEGVNAPVDVSAQESLVKKAVALRDKYHLPDFTGQSEWTNTFGCCGLASV